MASFGDSNDIKINVTLDTEAAVKAAQDLKTAIESSLKATETQFQKLQQLSKSLSSALVEQSKAAGQTQVSNTKQVLDQTVAANAAAADRAVKISEEAAAKKVRAEQKAQAQILEAQKVAARQAETAAREAAEKEKTRRTELLKEIAQLNKDRALIRRTPRAELPEDLGGVGSSGKLLKELEGIAVSVGNRFGFLTVSVEKSYKILSLLGQTTAGAVSAGMLGLKLAADKASVAIDQLAQNAGKLEGLKTGFETLQRSIGQSPIASIEALRKATQGLISDTELYQRANQAVLLGVPTNIFNEAAAAAVKLGRAMGIDAAFGLESLSLGLGRQSRLYLDNLGIVVSAEEAYRNFGATVGKSAADLDDSEKKAAFFAEALRKIKERADELPDPLDTVATAQTKANVSQENANRLYLEAFNNTSNLTEQYKAQQAVVEANAKNSQIYGAALGELSAIAKGVSNGFAAAGAIISSGFASALDYVFKLSPEKKIAALSDEIKATSAQLEVLKTRAKEGFVLDIFARANAQAIEELTKKLEEDNKKLETFKNLVGELDGKNIKVNIDLSGIETAQENIKNLFADITTEAEQDAGVFKIPGLPDAEAAGILDRYRAAKEEFDNSLNKTEALDKFKSKLSEIEAQVTGAPIKDAAKGLATQVTNLATAVTSGDFSKATDVFGNIGGALKELSNAARASQVGLKGLQAGIKGVNKALDEKARKQKKTTKESVSDLKKEQKALENFTKSINRALENAIPDQVQKQLVDIFNDPQLDAQRLADEIQKLGEKFVAAGGDVQAFIKEAAKLKDIKDEFPDQPIINNAETTQGLANAKKGILDIRKQLKGIGIEIGADGAFFGFDMGSFLTPEDEAAIAGEIQGAIVSGLTNALNSAAAKDYEAVAKSIGETIGAVAGATIGGIIGSAFGPGGTALGASIGAAIGAVIGNLIGEAVYRLGGDGPGTRERKAIDKYFADLFEGGRLPILDVVRGNFSDAIVDITNQAELGVRRISDLSISTANPAYFQTLSADVQASFNGIAVAFTSLLGVSREQAQQLAVALAANVGGSLQNLQVLIQQTGESVESLSEAVVKAFIDAQISIEEAYNSLLKIRGVMEQGLPDVVGGYTQAIQNFATVLRDETQNSGAYLIDSFRDIGVEAAEATGASFTDVITQWGQSIGLTGDKLQLFFALLARAGITTFEQLRNASDETIISILAGIGQIRNGIITTAEQVNKFPIIPTIKPPASSGPRPSGPPKKSPEEEAREKLREETKKLLRESIEYEKILQKITSGELSRAAAGAEIIKLQTEIQNALKKRTDLETALEKELDKGRKANKKRLADLAAQLDAVNERIENFTKKAETTTRVFKELNLKGVIPFIKDANNLGVIVRQVGVSFEKASDILVKGFLQGRLSLAELRTELDKTKETLGPGIPNAVGAVTDAFQNLIDAGTQGGQFSVDAFTDIFAEFREKFQKEGSALREAERKQLNENLRVAREAFANAVGPEATAAAKKTLDEAKKALDDFYAAVPAPDLADLRNQLEGAFGREEVDKFFQALDESGLKTFEDFEKAGVDSVVGILTRLQELGFNFGQTSQDIIDAQTKLREAEQEANAGLDPMQEAINLIKGLNEGAAGLPPVFNATTQAIENLNGPLGALASGFDDIIEKVAKLSGQTFENDVVFNVRTTGEAGAKALVDILFGDGEGATQDIPNTTSGNPPAGDDTTGTRKDKWVRVGPGQYKNTRTGKVVKSKTNPGRR